MSSYTHNLFSVERFSFSWPAKKCQVPTTKSCRVLVTERSSVANGRVVADAPAEVEVGRSAVWPCPAPRRDGSPSVLPSLFAFGRSVHTCHSHSRNIYSTFYGLSTEVLTSGYGIEHSWEECECSVPAKYSGPRHHRP